MSTYPDGPYEFDFPPELRPEDKASYGRPAPLPDAPTPTFTPPAETFAEMEARVKKMTEVAKKEGLPSPFDSETLGKDPLGHDDVFTPGVPLPLDIMDKYGIIDPTDERQRAHLAAPTPPPAEPDDPPKAKRKRAVAAVPPASARRPAKRTTAKVFVTLSSGQVERLDALCAQLDRPRSEVIARLLDASHLSSVQTAISPPTT